MTYEEVLANARPEMGKYCKACPVCDGRACKNQIPGPGAKGNGDVAIRNYAKWQEIRINMDTLGETKKPSTTFKLWGKEFKYPIFAGPVGAVNLHYGEKYNDASYNDVMVSACANAGILAMTGDGVNAEVLKNSIAAIKNAGGVGIPTIKPWDNETVNGKIQMANEAGVFAIAMDVDAAGLPFLKNANPPAGKKSVEELHKIVKMCNAPFIVKGVMTVRGALKAEAAGADAIVVSNHGGRVLDGCPATAEVLEEIVQAVKGKMKVFVDGGIRNGVDVFKALALGADGVIICRPFVTAVYGGAEEGIETLINKIGTELEDTMYMCGADSLKGITRDMVR